MNDVTPEAERPADPPEPTAESPSAPVVHEKVVVVPTRGYWIAIGLSLLFLFLAGASYREYLPAFSLYIYYTVVVLAVIVIVWCSIMLLRRGRIVHRTVHGSRAFARGMSEGLRAQGDAHEGAVGRMASKWARRFAKLGKAIVWLVRLPWRIAVWAWYTAEALWWRIILVAYDIVYYPTYAAWRIAHWAVRTAGRIVWWALGVAWKVLRLPLFLPFIKTWWRKKQRPKILARWRAFQDHRAHKRAMRIEKGRRIATLHGRNPDRWEADFKLRRGFPLPHPEGARISIRKRIAHIREVQRARREGRPMPRRKKPKPTEAPPAETVAADEPQKDRFSKILRRKRGEPSDAPASSSSESQPAPAES